MFESFCQHGLQHNQELHQVLIEQLLAVDDFLLFKAMMVKHNADLNCEVITLEPDFNAEPTSPAKEVACQIVRDVLDVSEWRLYAEQGLRATGSSHPACHNDGALEAMQRCEEAELQQ